MQSIGKFNNLQEYFLTNNYVDFDEWFVRTRQQDLIDHVMSDLNNTIVPNVLDKIHKPQVEESHIRDAIEILNTSFFVRPNSPIAAANHMASIRLNTFNSDVLKYTFSKMWHRYVNLKQIEMDKAQRDHETMINNLRQDMERTQKCMHNSKDLGKQTAANLVRYVQEDLFNKLTEIGKIKITQLINEILINPKYVVEKAFNRSFKSYDYVAVYKYVRNVVKYCIEVCEADTEQYIKSIIRVEKEHFNKALGEFFRNVPAFLVYLKSNRTNNESTIYELIQQISSFLVSTNWVRV